MTQAKETVKMGNGFKWFIGIALVVVLIAAIYSSMVFINMKDVTNANNEKAIQDAVLAVSSEKDIKISELEGVVVGLQNTIISQPITVVVPEIPEEEVKGYIIDKIYLNSPFNKILSDRELVKLFDGKIEFDDKKYDAEETLELIGLNVLANSDDYLGIPYLNIKEDQIKYLFTFENNFNTSEINEDETLTFNFLGEPVEISYWNGDEVTFTRGTEYFLSAGDSISIDGKVVTLKYVVDKDTYIDVDGIGKKITEGNTDDINGLSIKVDDTTYGAWQGGFQLATIIISNNDVETDVKIGDEYEDDSIWEWVIDSNSIGIILKEEFLDLDEDYTALAKEGTISLPNDYVTIKYNGDIESDSDDYIFDIKGDFIRVKGNFEFGTKDYDIIYIYKFNGSIYEDDDLDSYIGESVELSNNNDLTIFFINGGVVISDNGQYLFGVNSDLEKIFVDKNLNWTEISSNDDDYISSNDDDYLSNYGILVENPEDSIEDKEIRISVPETKIEFTASLY